MLDFYRNDKPDGATWLLGRRSIKDDNQHSIADTREKVCRQLPGTPYWRALPISTSSSRSSSRSFREPASGSPAELVRSADRPNSWRIRANRLEFLRTYRPASHIAEMDQWLLRHPSATARETVDEFERLIEQARARGALVSNHLSNTARDISWPIGSRQKLDSIEARISELGASVLREPHAAGGRHWHVDW